MSNDTTMTIIGNLTTDPEFRFTPNGTGVANFTIASTSRSYDRDAGEWRDNEAVFMRCNVWRASAENVTESLHRGSRVIVRGRLRQRSFINREGNRRVVWELDVDEIGPTLRFATTKITRISRHGVPTASVQGMAVDVADDADVEPDRPLEPSRLVPVGGGPADVREEAPF